MTAIVGWRLEGDKIILSIMSEDKDKGYDIELPMELYEELITSGPPSEAKKARELIDEIHRVKKEQILVIEEMAKLAKQLTQEAEDIRTDAMGATDKIEVQRLGVALRAVVSKRGDLAQQRYLCKLLDNKLGDLRARLLKMGR